MTRLEELAQRFKEAWAKADKQPSAPPPAEERETEEDKPYAEWGSQGGKARAEKLTKERRSQIARDAVNARWVRAREKQEG